MTDTMLEPRRYGVYQLARFVRESNAIEGIVHDPMGAAEKAEIIAYERLLGVETIGIRHLAELLGVIQPDAVLRDQAGLDVAIGGDRLAGGTHMRGALDAILDRANERAHPWHVHIDYELLHPFTDGNGRSGRALWAWQMTRQGITPGLQRGFLHEFYYQTIRRAAASASTEGR